MNYPSVAIVILNWNGKHFLEKFLPFTLQSNYPNYRVVVADNGSTDDSIPFLENNFSEVEVINLGRNYGFAKGYNLALQQIEARYFVLLNSDVEVTPGWITPIIALMESNKDIAACQPKIKSWHNNTYFEYAGASGGMIDYLGYAFCRGRIFEVCEEDNKQYDDSVPVFWASGCALFVKAEVYKRHNGLDEYFFAHQEEIDFCWRIQLAGSQVYVCPSSEVYHVGGGTLPQGSPRKTFLNYRNSLIMLYKNYTIPQRLLLLPVRLTLDGISVIPEMLKGDFLFIWTVFKSHMAFYKWLFCSTDKRFFPLHKSTKPAGIFGFSIIWQYFIKRKKYFSEIVD